MSILPLLSSLYIGAFMKDAGFYIVRSLIKSSPSLRHIRWWEERGLQDLEGLWTKRIESYSWLCPQQSCHLLHESSSLRELGVFDHPAVALTLPGLRVLRWSLSTYSVLHLITAPHLHTLVLSHERVFTRPLLAGSVTLPNLRVAVHAKICEIKNIHGFQTPALEHLSIDTVAQEPKDLSELFDGSVHMPTPKSLHLKCEFTDAGLIAVLGGWKSFKSLEPSHRLRFGRD